MAQGWYVSQDGKTTGPFSTEQVIEDVKNKRISADATVCAVGVTRFKKITDEPELAKAFEAPAAAPVCEAPKKCCPMPRVAAVTSLVLTAGFWASAAVAAGSKTCGTGTCMPVGVGLAVLAAVAGLALAVGIAKRKPRAHCAASALHLAGIVGAGVLAKTCCPTLLVVAGVHLLGLLATRGARKQVCSI